MRSLRYFHSWLPLLRQIHPPTAIAHIGAGPNLAGAWHQAWESADTTTSSVPIHLLEADPERYRCLHATTQLQPHYTAHHLLLGPVQRDCVAFHFLSNGNEGGLLSAEQLTPLWANIHTVDSETMPQTTLDIFASQLPASCPQINWLHIDCLPAAAIASGGSVLLQHCDVLIARVVLKAQSLQDEHATKDELDSLVIPLGLRPLALEEENNPALGQALYVRDYPAAWRHQTQITAALQQDLEKAAQIQQAIKIDLNRAVKTVQELQFKLKSEFEAKSGLQTTIQHLELKLAASDKTLETNTEIADFIKDISLFFYGRKISYVDVGAYIGKTFIELLESKEITIREAHLFEPNPGSYEKLKTNISSINIEKLHVYNQAIGAKEDNLCFSSAQSMTKTISTPLGDDGTQTGIFNIKCHALDNLADLITDQHVDLMKIDVEGFEMEVLQGTKQMLKKHKIDVIYLEAGLRIDGTQQTYFGLIDGFLQNLGYRLFRIYEQMHEWTQDSPLLRRCNLAYMSLTFAQSNPLKITRELVRLKKENIKLKLNKNEA